MNRIIDCALAEVDDILNLGYWDDSPVRDWAYELLGDVQMGEISPQMALRTTVPGGEHAPEVGLIVARAIHKFSVERSKRRDAARRHAAEMRAESRQRASHTRLGDVWARA